MSPGQMKITANRFRINPGIKILAQNNYLTRKKVNRRSCPVQRKLGGMNATEVAASGTWSRLAVAAFPVEEVSASSTAPTILRTDGFENKFFG